MTRIRWNHQSHHHNLMFLTHHHPQHRRMKGTTLMLLMMLASFGLLFHFMVPMSVSYPPPSPNGLIPLPIPGSNTPSLDANSPLIPSAFLSPASSYSSSSVSLLSSPGSLALLVSSPISSSSSSMFPANSAQQPSLPLSSSSLSAPSMSPLVGDGTFIFPDPSWAHQQETMNLSPSLAHDLDKDSFEGDMVESQPFPSSPSSRNHVSDNRILASPSPSLSSTTPEPYPVPAVTFDPIRGFITQRLPQCIIIGVRKCGTRALLEFMGIHSQVEKAKDEVHFFDEDSKYMKGYDWYRSQMPYSFSDQITVEKTPAYFVTDAAPDRIRAMNQSVRVIILVRDPVIRLISDYAQLNANKKAKGERPLKSFQHMVMKEDGSVDSSYKPVKTSLYAPFFARWTQVFPGSQIHVVDGDRLITDPFPEVQAIERFLKLTPQITRDHFAFNSTKGFYCIKMPGQEVEKCLNETKGRRHPVVPAAVIRSLRQFYAPYNRQFYSMVGKDFGWPII